MHPGGSCGERGKGILPHTPGALPSIGRNQLTGIDAPRGALSPKNCPFHNLCFL